MTQVVMANDQSVALPPLPDPLNLEEAMALADELHPDLALAYAELERTHASRLDAQTTDGVFANIDIVSQRSLPSTQNKDTNDSYARLHVSKTLYDFGRTRALVNAAEASVVGQEYVLRDTHIRRRIEIMQHFYDVLLADMRYAVDNEEVARLFVHFDRLRERYSLGQISEVELLDAENSYREVLNRRTASEKEQRASRQRLALLLNRPSEIPVSLVRPDIPQVKWKIPDAQELYNTSVKTNPQILSLQKKVESAKARINASRSRHHPTLKAEIEWGQYERDLSGRNDARIGLVLQVPLYQGGKIKAAVAHARVELSILQAQLYKARYSLQQRILELIQQLETLYITRESAQQRLNFRDRKLEKQRALYELEMQTTLGDAMMHLTEAQWHAAKVDFGIAIAWANLDALSGKSLTPLKEENVP